MRTILLIAALSAGVMAQTQGTITLSGPISNVKVVKQYQLVEKLSPDEISRLNAAQAKVDAAQKELESLESSIKSSHGQRLAQTGGCDTQETVVTFWGDYALIESNPLAGCIRW